MKEKTMHSYKVFSPVFLGILLAFGACRRESKHEQFKRAFEEFTRKECPKATDECTRMDSICYDIERRTITEYYTVMDKLDKDSIFADKEIIHQFNEIMLKTVKGNLSLKRYKDEGITFRYCYRSLSTGKTRLELVYTKEDYE